VSDWLLVVGSIFPARRQATKWRARAFESRQSLAFSAQQITDEPRRQKHSTSANPARR
jgi:hypothetical protein